MDSRGRLRVGAAVGVFDMERVKMLIDARPRKMKINGHEPPTHAMR